MSSEDQLFLIEQLANEFFDRRENNEQISLADYTAEHPEHAEELRDFIEGLELVRQLQTPPVKTPFVSKAPESPPTPEAFPEITDYKVIRELGRGAMGIVYEAEQLSLKRRVALKTMLQSGEATGRLRFQHEARTAARLHHPGIVPVYDVGESDGVMYYAMQFIEGRGLDRVSHAVRDALRSKATPDSSFEASLADWLMSGSQTLGGSDFKARRNSDSGVGRLVNDSSQTSGLATQMQGETTAPSSAATKKPNSSGAFSSQKRSSTKFRHYHRSIARIGWHVADALAFAHEQGVIHRDIKPANLLIDTSGEVWVADFGLVKTHDSAHTQTGAFVGTLRYMAPERFQGECDVRSDVYALGMTLYELLALRPALDSTDQMSLLTQIRDTEPQPLRAIEHRIPRDLEVIVMRAIQKEPHRRYSSARKLADDLDNYLNGRPIQARHVSSVEKTIIWARRKPIVAGLVSLLMFGLVATIFGSIYAAVAFRDIANVATDAKLETESTLARSNYFLAWARWEENRAEEANNLLDQIPDTYRNIEWSLAKGTFHGGGMSIQGSPIKSDTLRFTPDDEKLIWAGQKDKIHISESRSGVLLETIQLDERPYSLAVNFDGTAFATGDNKGNVCLWDVATGRKRWGYLKRNCVIKAMQFSPLGNSLAIAEEGGRVSLLDTDQGKAKWSVRAHSKDANGVAFHPNGEHLVSVGMDKVIRFCNATDGGQLASISLDGSLESVAYSPDGRGIAVSKRGGEIAFFHVRQKETIGWDDDRFSLTQASVMRGSGSHASKITFCTDGARIVSCGQESVIRIWRVETGEEINRLRGHAGNVAGIDIACNGYQIASAGSKTIQLWDARTIGSQSVYWGHGERVLELQFSSDGSQLLTTSRSGIRLWNVDTLGDIRQFNWKEAYTNQAVFSPDGKRVLACSNEGKVQVWDRRTGKSLGSYDRGIDNIEQIAFSMDGSLIAIADEKETTLLDVSRLTELSERRVGKSTLESLPKHPAWIRTLAGYGRDVTCVKFGPNDRFLATGDRSGEVLLWDFRTGEEVHRFDCKTKRVDDISFNPDGTKLVAVGAVDASVWDIVEGRFVGQLAGHQNDVRSVDHTPDGSRIITGGRDSTVRIWDASTGAQLCKLSAGGKVNHVKFDPVKGRIAAAHSEGVSLWETDLVIRNQVAGNTFAESADPVWHAKEADLARESGNWFAAVVHESSQLATTPDALGTQLNLYIAARTLQETDPAMFSYLPTKATEHPMVQLAAERLSPKMNHAWAEAIVDHVQGRIVGLEWLPIVEVEFELIKEAQNSYNKPAFVRMLALTHYRRNEFQSAVEMINANVATKSPFDFQLLAMCHLQLGDKDAAKKFDRLSRTRASSRRLLNEGTAEYKSMRKELNQLLDMKN